MRPTLPVGEHVPMPAADVHPTSRQQPGVLGLLLAVQERFRDIRGQNAASALTLSLFLSIFPLILVAVSVLGFVSAGDPNFVKDTIDSLNLTGEAQKIFTNAVNSAQENRGAVGIVGLITGVWAGLGVATALQVAANVPWQVAGRGIMPRAVAMVIDHCFFVVGLHRIEISIRPENAASVRVVEKLGIPEVGYSPRYLHIDGAWRDHRMFAITVEDARNGLLSHLSHK